MSDFLARIGAEVEKLFRGEKFSEFLKSFGIDPKRYWLLMDLFHMLSTRGEMQGQLGRQGRALKISTAFFVLFSGLGTVIALIIHARAWVFAGIMLGMMTFTLISSLLSEAANSLVNPEEALALSHQPINGATYTAAKLSHLLRIVLYSALGSTLIPALAMPFLTGGYLLYLPLLPTVALTIGILLALFCCSLYGLLMRVIPARRMKSASQFVQAIPLVIYGMLRFSTGGTLRALFTTIGSYLAPLAQIPLWLLASAGGTAAVAITVVGLRSLSSDYLIRASSMVHGHSTATTRVRRSFLSEIVFHLFGGQGGRAGFDYMKRMLLRDWQFRRRLLGFIPLLFGMIAGGLRSNMASPFGQTFTGAHFLPHIIGFVLYTSCIVMTYGTDYKGTWLFLVISDRLLAQFARGVHASLWLMFVVVPNVVLFPLFAWKWGLPAAAAYSLFSVAVSSVYLTFGIREIDGIPFGKQTSPGRDTQGRGGFRMIVFMVLALISVGIQYLIFRSGIAVAIATVGLAIAAVLLTKLAIRTLTIAIRHHIGNLSQTSSMLYTEVDMD
jgi:hypothetical protein